MVPRKSGHLVLEIVDRESLIKWLPNVPLDVDVIRITSSVSPVGVLIRLGGAISGGHNSALMF